MSIASLNPGETVLDLGSGDGIDCFLAARRVGASGYVIGVDMTPEMLLKTNYTGMTREAGFADIRIIDKSDAEAIIERHAGMLRIFSARIVAYKPR